MSGPIHLTLPYPPSANVYWRMGKGHMHRSTAANRYKLDVGKICNLVGAAPIQGDIMVTLDVYRPRRSGDLDNRVKCLLDAMQEHLYQDDSQIVEIHAKRYDDKRNPRVEVVIQKAERHE